MTRSVGVVIPVYNVENYLSRCIDSVLSQTYEELEIILVDDGSTDKSSSICDYYKSIDKRITVYHKANGGLSSARNYGVSKCKSDWVTFIDSDDFVTPIYIENLINLQNKFSCGIVVSGVKKVVEGAINFDNIHSEEITDIQIMNSEEALINLYYRKGIPIYAPGKLFLKDYLEKESFRVGELFEDLSIMHRLFSQSERIVFTPSANYIYRQRNGSIINSRFNDRKVIQIDICREIVGFAQSKMPNILDSAKSKHFVTLLNLYVDGTLSGASKTTIQMIKKELYKYRINNYIDKNNSIPIRIMARYLPFILPILPYGMRALRLLQNRGILKVNSPF